VDHNEFETIVITARGYICLFDVGDKIVVEGNRFAGVNGDDIIVVDDTTGRIFQDI